MSSLGFENYAEALKIYLSKYREVVTTLLICQLSSPTHHPHSVPDFN